MRRLACSRWGAVATTLSPATSALVHSTADYCTPVWCRSAHTCLIDSVINDALRTVTGCLRPAPADIFLSSQASNLLSFVAKSHTVSTTPPHGAWTSAPLSAHLSIEWECTHLKSRHPFVSATQHPSAHLTTITEMRCTRRINHLRAGFERFRPCLHKWAMAASATCGWRRRSNR